MENEIVKIEKKEIEVVNARFGDIKEELISCIDGEYEEREINESECIAMLNIVERFDVEQIISYNISDKRKFDDSKDRTVICIFEYIEEIMRIEEMLSRKRYDIKNELNLVFI